MRFTETVPAAAAAIKPKLAAAASTFARSQGVDCALTVMPSSARTSVKPLALPASGKSPLRSMAAVTVEPISLTDTAPPPAKEKPMPPAMATETAVDLDSIEGLSVALTLTAPEFVSTKARSMLAATCPLMAL